MNEYEAFGGNVLRREYGNTGRKTRPGTTLSTRIPPHVLAINQTRLSEVRG